MDESGGEARASMVDDAIVVKTLRPHRLRPRTSLAKDRIALRDAYLDGTSPSAEFHLMWTIAMSYTDLATVASGSPHAGAAVHDLAVRLDDP